MTAPNKEQELREHVKRFCRTDQAVDNLVAIIGEVTNLAHEKGYKQGWRERQQFEAEQRVKARLRTLKGGE